MSRIVVFPRLGASIPVPTPDSPPLPVTGAEVDATPYISGLIRSGDLLTYDPTGNNSGPPDYLPVGSGSASLIAISTVGLLALLPGVNGLVVTVRGYHTVDDGGGGDFIFKAGDATAVDNGLVFSGIGGRWVRILDNPAFRNVKWFGAKGDYVNDDTAEIQAAINSCRTFGAEVYFPRGSYRVSSTLKTQYGGAGAWTNLKMRGDNAGGHTLNDSALYWVGPTAVGSIMLQWAVPDSTIENLAFYAGAGFHVDCVINLGYSLGETVNFITHLTMKSCTVGGQGKLLANGTCNYAVALDFLSRSGGANTENCHFEDCSFGSALKSLVLIRDSIQPFNTVFRDCFFNNLGMRAAGDEGPFGCAIWNQCDSANIHLETSDIERVCCHVYCEVYPQSLVIDNCVSEGFKKIVWGSKASGNTLCPITIRGGRYSPGGAIDKAGEGVPEMQWAAGDANIIDIGGTAPLNLIGVPFTDGFVEEPRTKIKVCANDINSIGCHYGNTTPFRTYGNYDTNKTSRVFSVGDTSAGVGVGYQVGIPKLTGCYNSGGSVTISGGSAIAHVTLPVPEPQYLLGGGFVADTAASNYKVLLSVATFTGAPAFGTPFVTNKTYDGFDINLTVAPGVGNSITINYELTR